MKCSCPAPFQVLVRGREQDARASRARRGPRGRGGRARGAARGPLRGHRRPRASQLGDLARQGEREGAHSSVQVAGIAAAKFGSYCCATATEEGQPPSRTMSASLANQDPRHSAEKTSHRSHWACTHLGGWMRCTLRFHRKPWELVRIHDFSLIFHENPSKINEISWISMISQGSLGNLGVYLIQPPKICAGLRRYAPGPDALLAPSARTAHWAHCVTTSFASSCRWPAMLDPKLQFARKSKH